VRVFKKYSKIVAVLHSHEGPDRLSTVIASRDGGAQPYHDVHY
jgi:hypothetical protein